MEMVEFIMAWCMLDGMDEYVQYVQYVQYVLTFSLVHTPAEQRPGWEMAYPPYLLGGEPPEGHSLRGVGLTSALLCHFGEFSTKPTEKAACVSLVVCAFVGSASARLPHIL